MTVWAFNKADHSEIRNLIYQSVKSGKSRFGWSQKKKNNLKLKNNWSKHHSRQLFLLEIRPKDWIVHINTPEQGLCIAAKVISKYGFDDGFQCDWGPDFRHYFEIDVNSIVEFNRSDPNIIPTVNLYPRQRYHRVKAVDDFIQSIDNLQNNSVSLNDGESKNEYHLKEKTNKYISELTKLIHEMHRSKNLEKYLARVFRVIPGVDDVKENGFGWGTDNGADLIITMRTSLNNIELENRIIVQVKSFEGSHYNTEAVNQVIEGIKKFNGSAGMIITTAEKTDELENAINESSDENNVPIDLLAFDDLAKFIIKYAPEMLFNLN